MNKELYEIRKLASGFHFSTNHLYDGKPYTVHLEMVDTEARYYMEDHIQPDKKDQILAACWLHDTIEDCRLTYNDVKKLTNEYVANIVYAVSNEKGKTREERANEKYYAGIRETEGAVFVKLCDRIANVKYSDKTNNRMWITYRAENNKFLKSLFPSNTIAYYYMVKDLLKLLDL